MSEVLYRVWGGLDLQGRRRPDVWRTEAQLMLRWDWRSVHPEVRRRVLCACRMSGHAIGILSGARSSADQAANHAKYPDRFAPAGQSFHEEDAYQGMWALAVDLIAAIDNPHALDMLDVIGPVCGLIDFSDVNDEPWHVQPAEFPKSRSTYRANPTAYYLTIWNLPGSPIGDDAMFALDVTSDGAHYLWTPGGRLMWFASEADRKATLDPMRVAGVTVIEVSWSTDQRVAANNGGYYVPVGSA